MCTAITLHTKDHYFGRNLDLHYSYGESIVITPRNYPLRFRHEPLFSSHLAIIGTALLKSGYPLYYDAVNESGLAMAGLRFPDNASYKDSVLLPHKIAPFELIPFVLSRCETVKEALGLLSVTGLLDENFEKSLPNTPLHWLLSDKTESVTIEPMADGLKLFKNPVGVLTNSPSFPVQMFSLNHYMGLSSKSPKNHFAPDLPLALYSNGMGAYGLPGDWTSSSRFVKASFVKHHSLCGPSEEESVSQFFHLLSSVAHPRGAVIPEKDLPEITVYSCCFNQDRGICYYRTYENSRICALSLHEENLESSRLISYPMIKEPDIFRQNKKVFHL